MSYLVPHVLLHTVYCIRPYLLCHTSHHVKCHHYSHRLFGRVVHVSSDCPRPSGVCACVHAWCVCVCVCLCVHTCIVVGGTLALHTVLKLLLSGELIVSRYIAESITTDVGRFGHVGLCQLRTKLLYTVDKGRLLLILLRICSR